MAYLLLILAAIGAADDIAFSGDRLTLHNHPWLIRLRWSIIGAAIYSVVSGVEWSYESPWTWILLGAFLVSMAKTKKAGGAFGQSPTV